VAAPRPFWSGTISFGLVAVPVDLYPANRRRRLSLRLLAPDGTPLARRYYSQQGEEVSWEEVSRGYEVEDERFVTVGDEELEALAPEKTRDIDLSRFVDAAAIDPVYFQRGYFLTPSGDSTKAYRLLAAVMEKTGRAGIATFVMRGKEYLVAIFAEGGILRAATLRFADEIRTAEDVGLPEPGKVAKKEVDRMAKAIRAAAAPGLDEDELVDEDSRRLLAVVERKREAGEDVVEAPAGAEEDEDEDGEGADVIDLMEVIKRNLGADHKPWLPQGRVPRKGSVLVLRRGEVVGRRPFLLAQATKHHQLIQVCLLEVACRQPFLWDHSGWQQPHPVSLAQVCLLEVACRQLFPWHRMTLAAAGVFGA
jgi:DNA end-binding protein Ku